ncbi:MAG: acyl dehydratase [Aquabacterium sp.]|jgi:acyl dehydratase|uniref:MaoC/PaaZ C-terminal domain-containing protein n=1 Tax=Aquabacterium sp. TaxID=1872578 RepID=UPI001B76CF09|nr:MaoC/PaaZ C-terminal domain-containing protein [Aquabacterium sp.]MBP7133019.1 acyl dehydratase [Aquabacterium sp.]MBP9062854.1 acyl dehydratase [Aquabacterium sp.]
MRIIEVNKLPSPLSLNLGALRSSTKRPGLVEALPSVMYVRPRVVVDGKKAAAYAKVCGFSKAHGVPMLFLHTEAFPLAMMLFGSKRFPWAAMGIVHLANSATLHQRVQTGDVVRIEVRTGELFKHDKGQVFTLHARALRDGELVWESTWTLLRMGVRQVQGEPYVSALDDIPPLSRQADFYAESSIGRRYGLVSGDINPIHLSAITAKFLGFRRAVAHGMWTKAKALSTLLPREDVDHASVLVEFKTPLFLPARASLWAAREEHGAVFEVRNSRGDKPHLRGRVSY